MFSQILTSLALLACVDVATSHFTIEYPEMRGDSFATGASQWIYPCANVNQTAATNRTLWPLTGGSLNLDLHHPWTYLFVNLGLGTDYPLFNISLTTQLLNETGNGTLCLPQTVLPASVSPVDGQNASIQVVAVGESGAALYNCADITFSSTAKTLEGDSCQNSSNVEVSVVNQEVNGSTSTTSSSAASPGVSVAASGLTAIVGALAMSWVL